MARVILTEGDGEVVVGGSRIDVIGTSSEGETITVVSGNVTFNSSFTIGGDTINLPGAADDYSVRAQGAQIVFDNPVAGVTVVIPTGDRANIITFSGGSDARTLVFDSGDGRFELDGIPIGTSPAPVAAASARGPLLPELADAIGDLLVEPMADDRVSISTHTMVAHAGLSFDLAAPFVPLPTIPVEIP